MLLSANSATYLHDLYGECSLYMNEQWIPGVKKSCCQDMQLVLSTRPLLAQAHAVHFICMLQVVLLGPVKHASITGVACLSLPVYIHCNGNPS